MISRPLVTGESHKHFGLFMMHREREIKRGLHGDASKGKHNIKERLAKSRITPEKAAEIYAKRHPSDPHAYGRAMSRMMNGIFLPSEVTDSKGEI